jgi:hypothetical protein
VGAADIAAREAQSTKPARRGRKILITRTFREATCSRSDYDRYRRVPGWKDAVNTTAGSWKREVGSRGATRRLEGKVRDVEKILGKPLRKPSKGAKK